MTFFFYIYLYMNTNEMIKLLLYEIQKLKARITELEKGGEQLNGE